LELLDLINPVLLYKNQTKYSTPNFFTKFSPPNILQDHISELKFMNVIRQRDVLVLHGLDVLIWRNSLPPKQWNNRILNGIRLFLKQTSASDVDQPARPEHPWDRRVRIIMDVLQDGGRHLFMGE
jgi:hypothetical protein